MRPGLLSDVFKKHLISPLNVGELSSPSGVGQAISPICGDMMTIYIKVALGHIVDARFRTFGCWAALAAGSMITDMAKDMELGTVRNISIRDITIKFEGVPKEKLHCIELGVSALRLAVDDYSKRMTSRLSSCPRDGE